MSSSEDLDVVGVVDVRAGVTKNEIAEMFSRIDKVVPEEVDQELLSICQYEDQLQWRKGDLVNEIWKNVNGKGLKNKRGDKYTFLDVCFYVSAKYLRFSRSYNTVKAWALTARRYSPQVRTMYHVDDLPFSHFAYAAKKIFDADSNTGQKLWMDVLDFSVDKMARLGRTVSVLDLEKHFEGKKKAPATYQTGVYEFPSVEVTMAPVVISDVVAVVDADIDTEFREVLHKLTGLVGRITAKHPNYASIIQQGFALLSNALYAISQPQDEL